VFTESEPRGASVQQLRAGFRAAQWGGVTVVNDAPDHELYDVEELAEIRMTTDLMIAASESADPLSEAVIDQILGVGSSATEPDERLGVDAPDVRPVTTPRRSRAATRRTPGRHRVPRRGPGRDGVRGPAAGSAG
jgi:hypothetical protein